MIDLSAAVVTQISAHHVGSRSQDTGVFLSAQPVVYDQVLGDAIVSYCSRAFGAATEIYHFEHDVDLQYSVLNGLSTEYFNDGSQCHAVSRKITSHLYEQSAHPHIKEGDVLVVGLEQILLGDELVDGYAIIKAESKQHFLQLSRHGGDIIVNAEEGMQLRRMDKGALILNSESQDGFRVISVDNNRYDASYWIDDFLGIDHVRDNHFDTKAYVEMCKSFASEVLSEVGDKKTQVHFVQQTFSYIDQSEEVDVADFKETMFADAATSEAFDDYKSKFERDRGFEISETFEVSDVVIKKQKQKLRNFIKLDTNIKIQLGFSNAESVDRFVDRGWDEEKGMYFYKCYFNYES